jgi:hypothetical protein
MVPGAVLLAAAGRSVPASSRSPWRAKIPEADGGRRAASDPGLRRRRSGVGAGFEPEGGHLVLLVADAQSEMVQGGAKDGVGAIVERLKPPHKHRRCAGQVVGQLRRQSVGGSSVVSSGRVFGSTQCLRELLKKIF